MSDSARPTDAGISIFSTLDAFKDGLTSTLSLPAAADVCRGWVAKLDDAARPELNGIRDLLHQLADALDGDDGAQDGASIGDLMQRLGAHTSEAASTIGQDHLVEPLGRLGAFLSLAGARLHGGTRPDTIESISTETGPTPGDPELRSVNLAPDVSDQALDPDRAGAKGVNATFTAPATTPGSTTPGTKLDPK